MLVSNKMTAHGTRPGRATLALATVKGPRLGAFKRPRLSAVVRPKLIAVMRPMLGSIKEAQARCRHEAQAQRCQHMLGTVKGPVIICSPGCLQSTRQ